MLYLWNQLCESCWQVLHAIQHLPADERFLPKLLFEGTINLQNGCGRASGQLYPKFLHICLEQAAAFWHAVSYAGADPGQGKLVKTFSWIAIVVVLVQSHLYNLMICPVSRGFGQEVITVLIWAKCFPGIG